MKVSLPNGKTFDAVQWGGETVDGLPDWLSHCTTEDHRFYGKLLIGVGVYLVKPGSWVLRSDARGDVFPVPKDMFHSTYEEVQAVWTNSDVGEVHIGTHNGEPLDGHD